MTDETTQEEPDGGDEEQQPGVAVPGQDPDVIQGGSESIEGNPQEADPDSAEEDEDEDGD